MTATLVLQIILSILGLVATGIVWWNKKNDAITKEREDAKKQINDALASGDVSRIHSIIDKLRR